MVARPRREQMAEHDRVFAKCAWRLVPLIVAAYFANYLDPPMSGSPRSQ
jgi:hypothetical protein